MRITILLGLVMMMMMQTAFGQDIKFSTNDPNDNVYTENGNTLDVRVKVENDDTQPISTAFDVDFYLSKTKSFSGTYKIGSKSVSQLSGFAEVNKSISQNVCKLSQQIPDGDYYIIVEADGSDKISETDETNNAIYFANGPHFTANCPKPNLTIDTAASKPGLVVSNNRELTVNFKVANEGQAELPRSFDVGVYLSTDSIISASQDTRIRNFTIFNLRPGKAKIKSVNQLDLCSGNLNLQDTTYHVGVIIDEKDVIDEERELDNTLTYPNGPQLNLNCPLPNFTTRNQQLSVKGDSLDVSLTVKNLGKGAATRTPLGLYAFSDGNLDTGDLSLLQINLGTLPSDSTVSLDTVLSICNVARPQSTKYQFGALVDPGNSIEEDDETNNAHIFSSSMTKIDCRPNLSVADQSATNQIKEDFIGKYEITLELVNKGKGAVSSSQSVEIDYYLSKNKLLNKNNDYKFTDRTVNLSQLLKPGASKEVVLNWDFCNKPVQVTQEQAYYVFAVVDPNDKVPEANEIDNSFRYRNGPHIEVSCKPELELTGQVITDRVPQRVKVEVKIRNNGRASAGPFSIGIYAARDNQDSVDASDVLVGEISFSELSHLSLFDEFKEEFFFLCNRLKYDQDYYFAAVVDHTNQVDEVREDNNAYQFDNTIKSNCQSDLALADNAEFNNNGDTLNLNLSIVNLSPVPNTSSFKVDFWLSKDQTLEPNPLSSDIKVGSQSFTRSIADRNGYRSSASINFTKDLDQLNQDLENGDYYVGAYIDKKNITNDEELDNNRGLIEGGPHITVNTDNANVGLGTPTHESEFRAYPNPVHNRLLLNLPEAARNLQVQVHSMDGRLLQQRDVSGPSASLPVAALPSGVYMVVIQNDQGVVQSRHRIVKGRP